MSVLYWKRSIGHLLGLSLIWGLVSCSGTTASRYHDTHELEMPPVLEISQSQNVRPLSLEEKLPTKGLGDIVSLSDGSGVPILKVKKLFDRSWELLLQTLELQKIEVSDTNRERGEILLNYQPQSGTEQSGFTFFFFEDDYALAAYKIKVEWVETETQIRVELTDEEKQKRDQADEEFSQTLDDGGLLIKRLFRTMRDDLPLD
jgi:hypothetical protein